MRHAQKLGPAHPVEQYIFGTIGVLRVEQGFRGTNGNGQHDAQVHIDPVVLPQLQHTRRCQVGVGAPE